MIISTENLSFYLGLVFLALALIGVVLVCYLILRSTIDASKLDKAIEVGKWFIVSVALVVGTFIVSNGFKEREQDVRELEVFEKHAATIINADGPEKRYLLAEYFALVAPKGDLQESWIAYRDAVAANSQYKEFIQKSAVKQELSDKEARGEKLTEIEEKNYLKLSSDLEKIAKPLAPQAVVQKTAPAAPYTAASEEWVIMAGSDSTLKDAQFELNKAKRNISPAARIYKAGANFRTVIPNFMTEYDAKKRLGEVNRLVNPGSYVVLLSSLCSKPKDLGDFIDCN